MTQIQFAALLDTPVGTVRGWEQGRRKPHKTAQILFRLSMQEPEKVLKAAQTE
jgi:putative transcriptional regulator